jgi:hypothetical protein
MVVTGWLRVTPVHTEQNSAYGWLQLFRSIGGTSDPMKRSRLLVVAGAAAVLLSGLEAQRLGPGQLRPKPAEGREPEFPPPDIREYKPRSTLVVPEHPVPRAKFPVIDIHGHPPQLTGPDVVDRVVELMDPLNLRLMVDANATIGEGLKRDYKNERWLELALFPDRRYQDRTRFPTFEELMTERDHLLAAHPRTTFVLAHLGWHANNLARLGGMFDRMPNVYAEVGAVLYDIGRQPRTAHDFFSKYQDRLLFGKDSFQPDEYPYYWRVFQTTDEYFDYYRDYHAFWKLYGIDLSDPVLRKLYYGNALKVLPRIPHGGFPLN